MSVGQQGGIAWNRPGADRSGDGGRTAGAVDGGGSGQSLPFGVDNQQADVRMEGRRWSTDRNQRIATMSGIEAEFAVAGIAAGRVANEMADCGNLQDCQQECGKQDAEASGCGMVAPAKTVRPDDHGGLIPVMGGGCHQRSPPSLSGRSI